MICAISYQIDRYLDEEERNTHRCAQCGSDELFYDDEECNDCLPCENRCFDCGKKNESIKNNLCDNCKK